MVSPTLIIWHTMGGNTPLAASGSVSVFPSLMVWREARTAFSTTLLPAVLPVMNKASRTGTPDESRVLSVRVKRATAALRMMSPKIGSLSIRPSIANRPFSVL